DDFANAKYSAMRERSVGLGAMGFHSFLQSKMIPFEGVMASVWNRKIFNYIRTQADAASKKLAIERGACPDADDYNIKERFSNKLAIAPTASISIICGGTSPGIEPVVANAYTHKTLSGSFAIRNPHLESLLKSKKQNSEDVWQSIAAHQGSVKHLDFLDPHEKDVFKTAFEIDQRWLIDHAAERSNMICQAQSLNIFLPADVHKRDLHQLHMRAWRKNVKSLYYCRSTSLQRMENSSDYKNKTQDFKPVNNFEDECLSCQ
ncbi:MAG: ribonucleotide-diphosphate reductase subunit alpha, partial [Pseudomonadota bacterium]